MEREPGHPAFVSSLWFGIGGAVELVRPFRDKTIHNAGYDILKSSQKYQKWSLTPEWRTYQFETELTGVPAERVAVRFCVHAKSVLDLDDVYVSPFPENGKD